ncbi:ribonuclease E inhibitor RraB [Persicirhabdus sediminis]|uniref:Ribonuclease E inhibitor RraB n=1 Tax=Persicirhabdus sediminis TaxID=454144 RepID=A0A8J7MBG8_9BACT|nr:ribonuclease E inhibitor RraB [Persicirhabdus sediminis]MBK1790047.1 ribonuclease E inhibitor RraB [Persicirhabdus sediminis]
MKHLAFLVALLLTACNDDQTEETQTETTKMNQTILGKTITIDQLEAMFENIAEKTNWDLSGKMLWGYFFTHHEPKALEPVRDELITAGYRIVDLYQSDGEDQDVPPLWWLHVEREEIHTPQSLDQRNDTLYLLAARHGVDSYDGMDIGPIQNHGEQDGVGQPANRY